MKETTHIKEPRGSAGRLGARRALCLLISLIAVLAALMNSTGAAFASNPTPIPEPTNPPEPPPDYFTWSMASRFWSDTNGDGVVDPHYAFTQDTDGDDVLEPNFDQSYIDPATFRVTVTACPYVPRHDVTYIWDIDGTRTTISTCSFYRDFTPGTHHVKMSASVSGWPTTVYEEDLFVRDILIVALGDSFASGQGNPDIPGWPGHWVDQRCYRSIFAGPAQAARTIEQMDAHTSVTFISLACSGAQAIHVTDTPYAGPWDDDSLPLIPPQLDALQEIIGSRRIDALIISAGGNDLGFGDVIEQCLYIDNCHLQPEFTNITDVRKTQLPGRLAAMIDKIVNGSDGNPGLTVDKVYFTEYPNSMYSDDGSRCAMILDDARHGILALLPSYLVIESLIGEQLAVDSQEIAWAESEVYDPLNSMERQARQYAASHYPAIGWRYVDGMDAAFAGPGYGHGYCANDRWFRRILESLIMQGDIQGTMHPTVQGHQVYKDRILAYMLPDLFPVPGSVDDSLPYVMSILPVSASITSASSVDFLVTFSESVAGVDVSDFSLFTSGVSGASITRIVGVTGAGSMYYVRVNTGSGNGIIRLDFIDDDTVINAADNRPGGLGMGNGNYTFGESYVIDRTPPSVSTLARASASPASAASVDFTVTFSEPVTGVDANGSDFSLTTTGVTGATITGVTPVSASVYTVTVNTGLGNGSIRLDVPSGATIKDLANNNLNGLPFTGGESYSIIKSASAIDDTDPNWRFGGTWYTYTGAGPYGNSLHYASAADAYAEFTFVGQQFVYIYTADNNRGTIAVTVDGVNVWTISNYAASTQWQQQWTSPLLPAGLHTVRFTKGSGTYFDTDAIKIVPPAATYGDYDDHDSWWTFGGTWYTYAGAGPYGNSLHYASAADAYAEFTFVGEQFVYIYTADNNRGTIAVSVDGVNVGTINNYAASTQWQQQWTSPTFTSGIHTVRFVRNTGTYFDTDGIKILP